jgi:hypothetical protein
VFVRIYRKSLTNYKYSTSLGKSVNHGQKSFITLGPGVLSVFTDISQNIHEQKLKLTGQNLGLVFNSRSGRMLTTRLLPSLPKLPALKLNTRPKQLLGYLPLAFSLTKTADRLSPFLKHGSQVIVMPNNTQQSVAARQPICLTSRMGRFAVPTMQ